jgi:hypothetical protein
MASEEYVKYILVDLLTTLSISNLAVLDDGIENDHEWSEGTQSRCKSVELGIKNDCAGEDQQQFNRTTNEQQCIGKDLKYSNNRLT